VRTLSDVQKAGCKAGLFVFSQLFKTLLTLMPALARVPRGLLERVLGTGHPLFWLTYGYLMTNRYNRLPVKLLRMKRLTKRFLELLALLSVQAVIIGMAFLLCLLVFGYMAREVFVYQDTGLDNALFRYAASHRSEAMTRFMRSVSFFASADYLLVAPPLLVMVFAWFHTLRWYALKVLMIAFTSSMLNQLLKRLFERPRPVTAMLEQSGLSFPSGHAMIGGSFYGLLIYIIWREVHHPFWKWLWISSLTLLLLLIGYSRVYLNVHYATDVLAGYAMGVLWLLLAIFLMKKLEKLYMKKYVSGELGS
jgi:undecaprenyl-diphosphatase